MQRGDRHEPRKAREAAEVVEVEVRHDHVVAARDRLHSSLWDVRIARFERATYRFVARAEGARDYHQDIPATTKDGESPGEDGGE